MCERVSYSRGKRNFDFVCTSGIEKMLKIVLQTLLASNMVHILNKTETSSILGKTHYELWFRMKLVIEELHIFGGF